MTDRVFVWAAGDRRGFGVEVQGRRLPLLDGRTGEPAVFRKADVIGAGYGQRNEAWYVMRSMDRFEELKLCGRE